MTKYFSKWAFAVAFLAFISCSDSNDVPDNPNPGTSITLKDPVNDFIWKGMNSWYIWYQDSPKLADSKLNDKDEYNAFLNSYTDYDQLFLELCYQHINLVGEANAVDRFSWFIEDYEIQEQSFQGIRQASYGFRIQPVQINEAGDVIIYLSFVEPGSPSDAAGIERGDIINKINGTQLTVDSYSTAVQGLMEDSVTLSFVEIKNSAFEQLEDKSISRARVESNPVYLAKVFDDIGGRKVGYLCYNQFSASFNDELNAAFSEFTSAGINELVVDLRFNGGGSGETTTYLASMIYGQAGNGVFYTDRFNSKHSEYDSSTTFADNMNVYNTDLDKIGEENINRLNSLDRVYFLVTDNSASASELLINGLMPYVSEVKLIGTTTYGKNVGSITLYDNPAADFLRKPASSPHKYALQPICIQAYNRDGQSDYTQGFPPDILVEEFRNWDAIYPLGDENEVMLKTALDDIRGVLSKEPLTKQQEAARFIKFTLLDEKFEKELYFNNYFNKN